MKKMGEEREDLNKKLANFLMMYRKMPQATTNETPSVLLMKRNPRSRLDLIRPCRYEKKSGEQAGGSKEKS